MRQLPTRMDHSGHPAEGFVYVMECAGFYKIGWTTSSPRKRLITVQVGSPLPVTLVGSIEGSQMVEAEWHEAFKGKRVRGECPHGESARCRLVSDRVGPLEEGTMSRICASPSCEYPTGQDTFICKNCLHMLRRDLGDIPALIDDLHTTLSRQDVVGASSGRRASESSLPWKETASEALWVLVDTVMTWVREFQDPDAAPFPDAPVAAARWLLANATHVASREPAGHLVDEVSSAVAKAYEAIDRPAETLIAGQCGNNGCEEYLYARPDAKDTDCRSCGATHRVAERRTWMVNYAAEMQLPAVMCLSWVRLLMGKTIPRGTWDGWVYKSGRIAPTATDHVGNPLYRFGDVRDLAADWVARPRKQQVA